MFNSDDLIKSLGRNFFDLAINEDTYFIDDLEDNVDLKNKFLVGAKDGHFEMLLGSNKSLNEIHLFPNHGTFPFFNFTISTNKLAVRNKLGKPKHSGKGNKISSKDSVTFDIFELEEISFRFEYLEPLGLLLAVGIEKRA